MPCYRSFADAQNAEAAHNYARAAQDYSQALSLDPGNATAKAGQAARNAAFGDDNYAKAVGSGFAALGAVGWMKPMKRSSKRELSSRAALKRLKVEACGRSTHGTRFCLDAAARLLVWRRKSAGRRHSGLTRTSWRLTRHWLSRRKVRRVRHRAPTFRVDCSNYWIARTDSLHPVSEKTHARSWKQRGPKARRVP